MKSRTCIPDGTIPTLCRQCDMRCGVIAHIENGRIVKLSGNPDHPQNRGRLCPKAAGAVDLVYHEDRLTSPLKRQPDGSFEPIEYEQAMDEIARRIQALKQEHGARTLAAWTGEAVGFFQQEEYARRFAHCLGTPNYFSSESVCFAAKYIANCLTQGYYNLCEDYAESRAILIWGANLGQTHPPYKSLIDKALRKGAKLAVIDPRRTAQAKKAHLHIRPLPGTDGALLWAVIKHLLDAGAYDHEFVERHSVGFAGFTRYAQSFSFEYAAKQSGVPIEDIKELARLTAQAGPRLGQYGGISLEHQPNGTNVLRAIACLSGLVGALDHPGGNYWPTPIQRRSLRIYDRLPLWDKNPIGAAEFPLLYHYCYQCHSMSAMDRMQARGEYPLKGLLLSAANPVLTNPNASKVNRAFSELELFVVRDLFLTQTARLAHYVLPAASFLERSELHYHGNLQLVSLTSRVLQVEGAKDEYSFWHDLAHRLGFGERYFPWQNEDEVNAWILEPTGIGLDDLRGHPGGLTYAPVRHLKYKDEPLPTPSGKFEFSSDLLAQRGFAPLPEYQPPCHLPGQSQEYPFTLITGARNPFYYHSRYHNLRRFRRIYPDPQVEICASDAARLGIEDKAAVILTTAKGSLEAEAKVVSDQDTLPGVIQMAHGWDEANANLLTDDQDLDPISGFPNMKIVGAGLRKAEPCR